MKKNNYFYPALLQILLFSGSLHANHLEGFWRNDRHNITIRIEDNQDGFRAKRIDQGIWYIYITRDGHAYYDRYGNYYEVLDDDEIAWNETASGKRIRFFKVDSRDHNNHYDDDQGGEWNEHSDVSNYSSYQPWANHWDQDFNQSLNGRWIESYRGHEIEIECFRGGIRVKLEHGGWEKYYPAQNRSVFLDRFGNTLQIIDHDSIRWNSNQGGPSRVFHRRDGHPGDSCR